MGLKTRKAAEVAAKQQVNAEADAKRHLLVKMGVDKATFLFLSASVSSSSAF